MPQNPTGANVARNPSGALVPLQVDTDGRLLTAGDNLGQFTTLDITATTLITTGPGILNKLFIVGAPTAAGAAYDVAATGSIAASNQFAAWASGATGPLDIDWPFFNGLVVAPGTGGTIALAFQTGTL